VQIAGFEEGQISRDIQGRGFSSSQFFECFTQRIVQIPAQFLHPDAIEVTGHVFDSLVSPNHPKHID
jgi:hypothetical protein